jgi:hypothetical protein
MVNSNYNWFTSYFKYNRINSTKKNPFMLASEDLATYLELLICFPDVPASNFGCDTDHPNWGFVVVSHSLYSKFLDTTST